MTGIAPNSKAATCCQNSSYLKGIVLLIYDWLKILGKHSYCDRKTHQWETQYEQFSRNLCCESYNLYLCPKYVAELGYKQNLTIQV